SPCVPLSLAREESSLRASVEMTGPARVLIEITDSNPQQTLFVSRELTFEPYDGAIERARAIGLALGVLSSTLTHPNSSPLPDSEPDSEPTPNEDTVSESDSKKKVSRAQTEADKSPLPSYFVYAGLGAEVGPSWVAGGPSGSFAVAKLLSSSWGVALEGKGGFTRARESRPRLLHVDVLAGPLFYRTHAHAFTWAILSGGITWTEARLPL